MAQKKNHEVDAWIERPDRSVRVVLVYGPDRGMVTERARKFAASTELPLDDPFCVVKLNAADIESDPTRLLDEAHTVPMFGGERLIWLRNIATHKGITDAILACIANPPADSIVLIEAGDLKKSAALRTGAERGSGAMALPCYSDDGRGVDALIDAELARAGLSIELDARQLLKSSLGGDRLASRGEIEKLALYCKGQTSVSLEDVIASIGDVSAISADETIDAVLSGSLTAFDDSFARHIGSGTASFVLLAAAQRQLVALQLMRHAMDTEGKSAASAVASARPPVFFKRKNTVEAALTRWDSAGIMRAMDRLQATVLQTRQRPELGLAATRQALLALAVESARRGQRGRR